MISPCRARASRLGPLPVKLGHVFVAIGRVLRRRHDFVLAHQPVSPFAGPSSTSTLSSHRRSPGDLRTIDLAQDLHCRSGWYIDADPLWRLTPHLGQPLPGGFLEHFTQFVDRAKLAINCAGDRGGEKERERGDIFENLSSHVPFPIHGGDRSG